MDLLIVVALILGGLFYGGYLLKSRSTQEVGEKLQETSKFSCGCLLLLAGVPVLLYVLWVAFR